MLHFVDIAWIGFDTVHLRSHACRIDNEGLSLHSPYRQLHWLYLAFVNSWLLLNPSILYLMSSHMTRSPRPSSSVFAYCKWSNTGGGNSLWTRILLVLATACRKHGNFLKCSCSDLADVPRIVIEMIWVSCLAGCFKGHQKQRYVYFGVNCCDHHGKAVIRQW